ncbi:MAG: hypothetical protein QMB96_04695, partial [Acinetobacter towneri]
MNNSQNYVKQIKNAKRGGYTPTIAKDINKHKIQKAIRLIEQWRTLANELKPQIFCVISSFVTRQNPAYKICKNSMPCIKRLLFGLRTR